MSLPPRQANFHHGIDGLTLLALAYLALPNLIFVFGWFRLPVALVLACVLSYLFLGAIGKRSISWRLEYNPAAGATVLVTAFTWAAFGGGSHFMYANHDWIVRDAVLGDLTNAEWPVIYRSLDGTALILRSAIGYFLPPALIGKLFGAAFLGIATYLWTVAGVLLFLALLPLPKRAGWPLLLGLVVTVFFSGMDFLGLIIATGSMPIFPLRLEWWVPLSYPSLTGQLLWAPNHCLPIWIGTLLVIRHRDGDDLPRIACVLLPLTLIWTPFAAVGLLPFILMGARKVVGRLGWKAIQWKLVAACVFVSLPISLFLLTDIGGIAAETAAQVQPSAAVNSSAQAFSFHEYLIFVCCEFLLLALALTTHVRQARDFFAMAIAILLALPLIRFGPSNDLLLRLSTPPLIVLLAACLQALLSQDRPLRNPTLWLVWIFLAIGAHTAFNELWRSATFQRWKPDYRQTLADRQGGQAASHYVGRPNAPFLKQLLKSSRDN